MAMPQRDETIEESAQTRAESAQTDVESEKTRSKIEVLLDSFITDAIRSDARRNMIAILGCLSRHPEKSAAWIAKESGLSQSATQKIMGTLQKAGLLRREGPDFGGRWVVIGLNDRLSRSRPNAMRSLMLCERRKKRGWQMKRIWKN